MTRQTIRFSAAATALAIAVGFALPAPAQQAAALTLEAAERAFGLGEANDQVDYETRRASGNQIIYQDVALNDLVQAERMILRVVDGDGGRREAVVRLEGVALPDAEEMTMRAVEMTGIDPRLIGPDLLDFEALMEGDLEIAGDIQLEGVEIRMTPDDPALRVARIRLDNIDTTEGYLTFDSFELNGMGFQMPETGFALDTIRIAGISDAIFNLPNLMAEGEEPAIDQLTIDEFSVKGLVLTGFSGLPGLLAEMQDDPRAGARKALAAARDWIVALHEGEPLTQLAMLAQPEDDGVPVPEEDVQPAPPAVSVDFRLGEFTLRDIGLFKRTDFVMKGFSSSYAAEELGGTFAIDELSFDDLNTPFLMAPYFGDFGELPEEQAERTIGSIVPEGPAAMSATRFVLRGVSLVSEGVSVTLDRLEANPVFNSDGKITAMETPAGQLVMRDSSEEGFVREGFDWLGLQELTVNILPSRVTWDAATDTTHQEPFGISFPGLVSGSFEVKLLGYNSWMNETSLQAFIDANNEAMEQAVDAVGTPNSEGMYAGLIAGWVAGIELAIGAYDGISLQSAGFNLADEGILATVANRRASDNGTTAEEERINMAAEFATDAANKSSPLWERLFSNALRGFVTEGGRVSLRMMPASPIPLTQLTDTEASPDRLGVSIEHTPAAPAARAN